jgi:glucose/arabinose dehydrogenase
MMPGSLRAALLLSEGLAGPAAAASVAAQNPSVPPGFHVSICAQGPNVGRTFPAYHDAIFIAEHGSWNRSSKAGYRGVVVHVGKDGKGTGSQPFPSGFLDGQKTRGRPADVRSLRDGSLPVSDDDNDVISRVTQAMTPALRVASPAAARRPPSCGRG